MLISLCFDMFPGAVCRLQGEARCELHSSLLTRGLWGMAHTWKHFRASLHCNWAYYHNYSFKAPAICIRHAPAQPPGLWPCRATRPPPFYFLHTRLCLCISFSCSLSSHSPPSLVTSISGEKRIIHEFIMLESLGCVLSGPHNMSEFYSWPQRIAEGDREGESDIKGCRVVQR